MKNSIVGMTLAFAVALLSAPTAHAAFVVSQIKTTATGVEIYQIQALNDGTGGTGTQLAGIDLTLRTVNAAGQPIATGGAFKMDLDSQDFSGDGVFDANVSGAGRTYGNSTGTWMRIGNTLTSSWVLANVNPAAFDSDPGVTGTQTQPVDPAYANLHVFGVAGIFTAGGGVAANATPAKFVNIVVPTGTLWDLNGTIGGNLGDPQTIFATNAPEPGSLALVTIGLLAFAGRRRTA